MVKPKPLVLVAARENEATQALLAFLRQRDLEVIWARDGVNAYQVLDDRAVDLLVTESSVPRIDGMALLTRARARRPEICVVVVTEGSDPEGEIEAMRRGAYDVQARPLHFEKLMSVLERGLSHQALVARVAEIEARLDERLGFERLTGRSRGIQLVLEQVRSVAATRATVLIEGEAGTGKGLVAEAIHQHSPRKAEDFVRVNCEALAGGVIESELFGHERDPATGAAAGRGHLELADGGTLFLDEIGEAPASVQVRLLRVLQDRAFERVGGVEPIKVDVRLIASTRRDLAADAKAGRFREDLFYRLSVVRVHLPPLRERREDIPLLVESFVREFDRVHGRRVTGVTRGVLDRLARFPWPGNVRELRDTIEGMIVLAEGKRPLDLSDLPAPLRDVETEVPTLAVTVGMTVEEAERQLIAATLERVGHDKPRAAAMLGIGLRTLYRKIKQYSIH